MKRIGLVSITCAAALTVACNGNPRTDDRTSIETAPPAAVGTAGEVERNVVSTGDREFVHDLLVAGTTEVDLGKMASERATNPDVKRFGQMMVTDHTKAGTELKQIAAQYAISTDVQLDEKHRDVMNKLSKLRGADFDRQYIDAMVDGHEDVVDRLQARVDSNASLKDQIANNPAKDTNVKPESSANRVDMSLNQWAAATLPKARSHLDEAKRIKDSLNAALRNTTASR